MEGFPVAIKLQYTCFNIPFTIGVFPFHRGIHGFRTGGIVYTVTDIKLHRIQRIVITIRLI